MESPESPHSWKNNSSGSSDFDLSSATSICSDSVVSESESDELSGLRNTPTLTTESEKSPEILKTTWNTVSEIELLYNLSNVPDKLVQTTQECLPSSCSKSEDDTFVSITQYKSNKENFLPKVNIISDIQLQCPTHVPTTVLEPSVQGKQQTTTVENVDRVLNSFGKIVKEGDSTLDSIENHRRWTKKNCCPYCFNEVTHFPRHLQRNHADEGAVKEFLSSPINNSKRKILLDSLRRQGNYFLNTQKEMMRPIRRPRKTEEVNDYIPCNYCLGFFKKNYLRKHRKKCSMNENPMNQAKRENHLSESQAFFICSGAYKDFYDSLRLKKEVLNKMRVDEISKIVIGDVLICSYGESQLRRHKRVQLATSISNKMRELGRLLLTLKDMTGVQKFIDVLKPELFDNIVTATQIISGYDKESHSFKAASLALHMSTRLMQVCDVATKLIIKKSRFLRCDNAEGSLKNIKRLRALISSHWNSEISSVALKDLNEKQWEKPKLFPLTSELMQFQKFVMTEANKACEDIKENKNIDIQYRKLSECILALTLLLNRKRIGEVQFLKLKKYASDVPSYQQEEFLESLSDNEKILTRHFKRVVTGGKGSKPVVILFPKRIQLLINIMLSVRDNCVPGSNEYLFANPSTENRWLSGYHVLRKLAEQSGVAHKELFTSTRLRKQIATVLQVMNVTDSEMEQFASFMGHTKKTHQEYYRLPQDVYQTAKVSKILLAINKGKGAHFKGKTLDEIEFSDSIDSDDSDEGICNTNLSLNNPNDKPGPSKLNIEEHNVTQYQFEEMKVGIENDSSCIEDISQKHSRKGKIQRTHWTEEQGNKIRLFFKDHINKKIAPKKHEIEVLIKDNKELFRERNWVKIKAYVYNSYRKK